MLRRATLAVLRGTVTTGIGGLAAVAGFREGNLMDTRAELSQLPPDARASLAQRIRNHLSEGDTSASDHDVAIVGGGVAALTLALEIRRARPQIRVFLIESKTYPVPEITHKVGESTVEVASHYLRDRLGLGDHLHTSQVRKMGLRMFFSHNGNTDIARRVEVGSSVFTPTVTYQIDRGRLENELNRRCRAEGIEIACGAVRSVDLGHGARPHTLSYESAGSINHTTARWVVDASGRSRALARQLDLRRSNGHNCNAVWLRVAAEIDINEWSDEPDWRARIVEGDRALSTNHLMGEGYWVWIIRLASGSTSIGIVADPDFHAFNSLNTLGKARSWLSEHEPQCAAALAKHEDVIQDFKVMKNYSHGVTRVFDSRDRWCLTGDSGIFLDPLYSSGLDLIALGNGLVVDIITRDLNGENIIARSQLNDSLFRSLTDMWLAVYEQQYVLMGSPAVMSSKIIWDIAFYWGFLGFLYINDRFVNAADDPAVLRILQDLIGLSNRIQQFFREWASIEGTSSTDQFIDFYSPLNFMVTLHAAMNDETPDVGAQFDANARLLSQLAGQLVEVVIAGNCNRFDEDNVVLQVQAWQQDSFLRRLRSTYREQQATKPVSQAWILSAKDAQIPD